VIASIVDTHALLQVVWVSLLAGVGVTAAYGVALLGATRAIELARDGRGGVAVGYAFAGVVGLAIVLGAIVFGIVILVGD
jgi:hypothetical protein